MSAIVERSPLVGTVVAVRVVAGQVVSSGTELVVIESMKMEHPVVASSDCVVVSIAVVVGQTVREGEELLHCEPSSVSQVSTEQAATSSVDRADLAEYQRRRALLDDSARTDAVAKRHAKGQRTARENIADLVDGGSFVEYGSFGVAAQRARRSE